MHCRLHTFHMWKRPWTSMGTFHMGCGVFLDVRPLMPCEGALISHKLPGNEGCVSSLETPSTSSEGQPCIVHGQYYTQVQRFSLSESPRCRFACCGPHTLHFWKTPVPNLSPILGARCHHRKLTQIMGICKSKSKLPVSAGAEAWEINK